MAQTQQQAYCHRCDRETLHSREIESPNHMLNIVLILFCCGMWVPVYLLLLMFPKKHPWMCSACGERMGHVPREVIDEERAVAREERERQRDVKREAKQRRRDERQDKWEAGADGREERADDRRERRENIAAATKETAAAGYRVFIEQLQNAAQQANRVLKTLAGDDNFLLRIYQAVAALVGLLIACAVLYIAAGIIGRR